MRRFRKSEDAFHFVATGLAALNPSLDLRVTRNPKTLRLFYREDGETHRYGLSPEEEILHIPSGRILFFEVKNQGPRGNAEERAYRHHTMVFSRRIMELFKLDYHPYFTIFTGNLATDDRYILKFRHHIETTHYFLWRDYNTQSGQRDLQQYLMGLVTRFLIQR